MVDVAAAAVSCALDLSRRGCVCRGEEGWRRGYVTSALMHTLTCVCLQDNNDFILMRVALAVMEEVQGDLLRLHDFEAIITHLKVAN